MKSNNKGTLLSKPSRTHDQLIKYVLNKTKTTINYTPLEICQIVQYYWKYGIRVGIDPVIAVVQMLHETGNLTSWWSMRPRRNPAGLGVNGRKIYNQGQKDLLNGLDVEVWHYNEVNSLWEHGHVFSSWNQAVRAHIGHLLCYALEDSDMNKQQRYISQCSPRRKKMPSIYRGCARVITDLNGRWAVPGKNYGFSILTILNEIR